MSDGVKKTFKDYPPPPQDEARTRWTRPTIRELGRAQETESGPDASLTETTYFIPESQTS